MVLLANIFGVLGVIIINISYCMLSTGKLKPEQISYSLSNLIGALCIVVSLLVEWNLSAFLMEFSWVLISGYGMVKALRSRPIQL